MKKETLEAVREAYRIEYENILEMTDFIDEEVFGKAVGLLKSAPRIGTTGCGHSGIACQHVEVHFPRGGGSRGDRIFM